MKWWVFVVVLEKKIFMVYRKSFLVSENYYFISYKFIKVKVELCKWILGYFVCEKDFYYWKIVM